MGRKRKRMQKIGERKNKPHYDEIVKENKKLEDYYKEQKCFDISEFDVFMSSLRLPLPAVFRISGYKKHSKQLLKNMRKFHFAEMSNLEVDNEKVEPPTPLPWYPDELAWNTSLNRTQIRRAPQLQKFHAFLIAENESGHITRQEAVSMIPPLLLDVKSQHKVLDMCAAPGSKTAQLIELIHQDEKHAVPEGLCIANDKDNKRCYMLVHQMNRLNSPSTIIVNHDAATFPEIYLKDDEGEDRCLRYDRVLCDVPCSGDGTVRKNYDVWQKWDIASAIYLHGIQLRILMRGLELLTTGGQLVYSTCSLNPIEDEAVVGAALAKCGCSVELIRSELPGLKWIPGVSSWRVMDRSQRWYDKHTDLPSDVTNISTTMFPPHGAEGMHLDRCMRLLPHLQDTGGFFVAVLRKQSPLPWQRQEGQTSLDKSEAESTSESPKQPPRKKPRWIRGFKEDPFVFFNKIDEEKTFAQIKMFYGFGDFPMSQLLTRTEQERKKHVYFVSEVVKDVLRNNIEFLKVINTGVRMFSRADNSQHDLKCGYRLAQSGVECVEPYMTRQRIDVTIDDVIKLLVEEQPNYSELSAELREQLQSIDPGSVVYKYTPKDDSVPVSCDLLMCGWKGYVATRLYMSRHERMHYLNLCGHPVPDRLMPNNTRRGRAARLEGGQTGGKTVDDAPSGGDTTPTTADGKSPLRTDEAGSDEEEENRAIDTASGGEAIDAAMVVERETPTMSEGVGG